VDTLATELSLSMRDACEGIVVSLEVPLRGTCADCGGRGETWTEPCGTCCGTGDAPVRQPVRLSLPPGVAHGARFHFHVRSPLAVPVRLEVRVAVRSAA
jgi:DnaJ-class molecular chaperone